MPRKRAATVASNTKATCSKRRRRRAAVHTSAFHDSLDVWPGLVFLLAQHLPSAIEDRMRLALVSKKVLNGLCPPCECGGYAERVYQSRLCADAEPFLCCCGPQCQRAPGHQRERVVAKCRQGLLGSVSQWARALRSPFALEGVAIHLYSDTVVSKSILRTCAMRLPNLTGLTYVSMPGLFAHQSGMDEFVSALSKRCAEHITFLDLSNSQCFDGGTAISTLSRCKKLQQIHLKDCRGLTNIAWGELPSVEILDMSSCIELVSVKHEGMPRVKSLLMPKCSSLEKFSPLRTAPSGKRAGLHPVWINVGGTSLKNLNFMEDGNNGPHYLNLRNCPHIHQLGNVLRGESLRMLTVDEGKEILEEIAAYKKEVQGVRDVIPVEDEVV